MLPMRSVLSQTAIPEPFSFKSDKLGMGLDDFRTNHRDPGEWENKVTRSVGSHDSAKPSPGKNWEWVPSVKCKENVKAVTVCDYMDTITNVPARATATFADGKLASINLLYWDAPNVLVAGKYVPAGDVTWQALIAKFGTPQSTDIRPDFPISGNTRRILRWDNGVSIVEFENDPCNGDEIREIIQGHYCESPNTSTTTISIWYVHKALAELIYVRRKEDDNATKKARSDL
jgi:hypothetical protein